MNKKMIITQAVITVLMVMVVSMASTQSTTIQNLTKSNAGSTLWTKIKSFL